MQAPRETKDESERLKTLLSLNIMDSDTEEDFDNLTKLASQICGTKISLVSLVDDKRQWFKSRKGLDASETPKDYAFCGHAIHHPDELFMICDARKDERFHDNPLVTDNPHVIFYAGFPLVSEDEGHAIGTLCVIDDQPNELNEQQIFALKTLSKQVMSLIELRSKRLALRSKIELLEKQNTEIENFAHMAAHDLKSPLQHIYALIGQLKDYDIVKNDEVKMRLDLIGKSSRKLSTLIDQLLKFSKRSEFSEYEWSVLHPNELLKDLFEIIVPDEKTKIELKTDLDELIIVKTGVLLTLNNLITNAIKYCDKENVVVSIQIHKDDDSYQFTVVDNGPGVDEKHREIIFNAFENLNVKDRNNQKGSGLGLAHVKRVISKLGGSIDCIPVKGVGAKFVFTLPMKRLSEEQKKS